MNTLVIDVQDLRAQEIEVSEKMLIVSLADGCVISVPFTWFPRPWYGTSSERANFEIIGDRNYLHWPELDEDLSISAILAGRCSKENPESLKKWLESRRK